MNTSTSKTYQEALTLALQLPPVERIAMIAELAVSITESTVPDTSMNLANDNPLSDAEVTQLMTVTPLSPKEIAEQGLLGSWSDLGITDGAEWVVLQKHKRRESRKWQMPS